MDRIENLLEMKGASMDKISFDELIKNLTGTSTQEVKTDELMQGGDRVKKQSNLE